MSASPANHQSASDIRDLVQTANEATKDLDSEVRSKAFEIVLNHLINSRVSQRAKKETRLSDTGERPKIRAGNTPSVIKPIAVDLKRGKEGPGLREFYKAKAPETHQEKVTVFTYYLNKNAGVDDVLPGHILTCYNEVGERKPAAMKQLLTDTISKAGWLDRGSVERSVRVNITGENLVEQDLPRKKSK